METKQSRGASATVVTVSGISKSYGPVVACQDVSFTIRGGCLTAVIGDNGAGKSTVAKVLTGALKADSGTITVDGDVVDFANPMQARLAGVEAVQQELGLCGNLDVAANIFLGREPSAHRGWFPGLTRLRKRQMAEAAAGFVDELGVNLPAVSGLPVESMSGGQRQSIAIIRALYWSSKLLVLDEPTAALGVRESAGVLRLIEQAVERGVAVLMISHQMPQVVKMANHVVVMRHGKKVADLEDRSQLSVTGLVELIVGAEPGAVP